MKKSVLFALGALLLAACGDDAVVTPEDTGSDTSGGDADAGVLDVPISDTPDVVCTPQCDNRECGDDGCGGTCGTCEGGTECELGQCVAPEVGDCADILTCVNTNQCQDQACLNTCLQTGTAEAQTQFTNVLACLQENCADATTNAEFAACQQEYCQNELNICSGQEGPPEPTGTDTCEEVVSCMTTCLTAQTEEQFTACFNTCYGMGTDETSPAAAAGLQCVFAAPCVNDIASVDDFFTCFEDSCPDEWAACYPPTCAGYCTAVTSACTDDNAQYDDASACIDYCEGAGMFPVGVLGDTDGNSIGCRLYHAGVAGGSATAADTHCDHAGPSGGDMCGSWCENYCALALNNCTDDNELFADEEACMTACAEFSDEGAVGDTSGDSVQCRIQHLGLAGAGGEAAAMHCMHGSVSGGGVCGEVAPPTPSCEEYCTTVMAACTGDNAQYESPEACAATCADMTLGTVDDRANNTVGCRTYHAGVAGESAENATTHCPHAGSDGGGVCVDAD
ncbi:MAG: hypothetical protein H6697_03045 [Myxococcales bacterium]|nr:hypothetical protein [Myxococcales bacterium]MCB9520689.1 hypothetical protein [Myxococcales bacterium]